MLVPSANSCAKRPGLCVPAWVPLLRKAWQRCKHFITKAGGIILTVTVVVWFLGYFPNVGADLGSSWLGQLGHFVGPLFEPLGLDWRRLYEAGVRERLSDG